jgi:hypothetical protein
MILVYAFVLYAALGVVIGLVFVAFGVTRVLGGSYPVTLGARILLLPGAAAFWPYVLMRWLRAGPLP